VSEETGVKPEPKRMGVDNLAPVDGQRHGLARDNAR